MSGIVPRTFRREIVILFLGKLVVLMGLFFFCFSPQTRPHMDANKISARVLGEKKGMPDVRP